ncbi:glycosyltransferase family 9 protein [Leucobacter sp. USCH14]|uniref:glycosyltransferase family 9 protein n=1 Tax=Leucobacter sp. USCH14 TaxID=3024838 RepID=UPI00309618B8
MPHDPYRTVDESPLADGSGVGARRPVVGVPREQLEGVRKIAVLRGGGIGDLLFALPAITALSAAYPEAEVTLLGAPSARLLEGRAGAPHRVVELPIAEGVHEREGVAADPAAVERFLADQREEGYDLAAQLHGGGRFSNPFLVELGARCTIGTRTDDALELDRSLPYVYFQHEVMRWLEVVALVGAPPVDLEPRLAVTPAEVDRGRERLGGASGPTVVVHPGATDPRRRWPAERFGAVAAELTRSGVRVAVIGDASERSLADAVVAAAVAAGAAAPINLAGELPFGDLPGVLAAADLCVANDSGPRHLAQAVGTTTASVFWCGNMLNAGPLGRGEHRAQLSWTTNCPVCGRDSTQVGWTAPRCEHDVSFVADVSTEAVLADARALLDLPAR